jgi:hypothetical protein
MQECHVTFKISHVVSDLSERTSSYACAISGSLKISDGAGMMDERSCYRELWEGNSRGEAMRKGSFEEVGMEIQGPEMHAELVRVSAGLERPMETGPVWV